MDEVDPERGAGLGADVSTETLDHCLRSQDGCGGSGSAEEGRGTRVVMEVDEKSAMQSHIASRGSLHLLNI